MKRNRKRSKQRKLLKYLATILICIFIFPANYSGKPLKQNFTSWDPEFPNTKYPISTVTSHPNLSDAVINYLAADQISDTPTVTETFVTISILVLILATILLSLTLGYFYSVPIVRQSLVLYLYQDISILVFLFNVVCSVAILTCYVGGNGRTIHPTTAKVITYCICNVLLYLLLASNVQGFLHLYSMKEMVLDPALPWITNDRVAIKIMRFTSLVIVTSVTSLLFANEGYPMPYYVMIGDVKTITELPIEAIVFPMLVIVLIVTYIITSLAALFYKQRSIYFGDNTTIPRGVRHILPLLLFFMAFVTVFGLMLTLASDRKHWFIPLINQMVFGVLSPIFVIASSSQIKGYVNGIFQASSLFVSGFYEQYFSRCSPQVYPMEE